VAENGDKLDTVALDELARSLAPLMIKHLENCIDVENTPFQKGDGPTMKINRAVVIGEKSTGYALTLSRNTLKNSWSYTAVVSRPLLKSIISPTMQIPGSTCMLVPA
jgi:hypothetical protein